MRLDEEYCLSEYVDLGRLGDNEKVHINIKTSGDV